MLNNHTKSVPVRVWRESDNEDRGSLVVFKGSKAKKGVNTQQFLLGSAALGLRHGNQASMGVDGVMYMYEFDRCM